MMTNESRGKENNSTESSMYGRNEVDRRVGRKNLKEKIVDGVGLAYFCPKGPEGI